VAPLNISRSSWTSTTDLFDKLNNQVSNSTNRFTEVNKKILADVTTARSQVAGFERQLDTLDSKIAVILGPNTQCKDVINEIINGEMVEELGELCRQRQIIIDQINTSKIQIALQVGVGLMNDEILMCSAGVEFTICREKILRFRSKYNQQLGTLSDDPMLKQKLDDYARYAAVLSYAYSQINLAVDSGSLTPIQAAIQAAGVSASTVIVGATGGVIGGAVGGVVGGGTGIIAAGNVAQSAITSLLTSLNNARKIDYANTAANNIHNYTTPTIASIQDPQLKQLAQSEINDIETGLRSSNTPTPPPIVQTFVAAVSTSNSADFNQIKSRMDLVLYDMTRCIQINGSSQGCGNGGEDKILAIFQDNVSKLQPNEQQQLAPYANYIRASINLTKQVLSLKTTSYADIGSQGQATIKTYVTSLNQAVATYFSLRDKDPAIATKMEADRTNFIRALNSRGANFTPSS